MAVLVCHLMSETLASLGFGLLGSSSVQLKFHGVLCVQRNQESIVSAGPVMCYEMWAPLTGSLLGGIVIESLFSLLTT